MVKKKLMFLAFVARVESEILFSGDDVTPNIACYVKKVKNKKNI